MVSKMNDEEFLMLDEKLYGLLDSYINSDFTINEDQKTFNKYCKIRSKLVKFVNKTNQKLKY